MQIWDIIERLALTTTCPRCRARPAARCRTPKGRVSSAHVAREKVFRVAVWEAYQLGIQAARRGGRLMADTKLD